MHERMQEHPEHLDEASLLAYAVELELNVQAFKSCLEDGKRRQSIRESATALLSKGVAGTPSFVIGEIRSNTVQGELVAGVVPYGEFKQSLDRLFQMTE